MSSLGVRTAARTMALDASWPAGIPYFEVENVEVDETSLPDSWCALQFDPNPRRDALEVGPRPKLWAERGSFWVHVLLKSGTGDVAAMNRAEEAHDAVVAWAGWPAGFTLETISPPGVLESGGDGTWYRVDLECEYRWQAAS